VYANYALKLLNTLLKCSVVHDQVHIQDLHKGGTGIWGRKSHSWVHACIAKPCIWVWGSTYSPEAEDFLTDRTATQYDRLFGVILSSLCLWLVHSGSQGWCTGLKVVPACSRARYIALQTDGQTTGLYANSRSYCVAVRSAKTSSNRFSAAPSDLAKPL